MKLSKSEFLKEYLAKEKITYVVSILTWDEIVYSLRKLKGEDISIQEGRRFLKFPNLIFVGASEGIVLKAQELMEQYHLKPRDAIHAATALKHNCTEIITDDSDFDKVKELKRVRV